MNILLCHSPREESDPPSSTLWVLTPRPPKSVKLEPSPSDRPNIQPTWQTDGQQAEEEGEGEECYHHLF